jgi:cytochrome c peroxidase
MLHDVALTAPYGHAGEFATLSEFVRHYTGIEGSNRQYDIQANVSDPELVLTLVENSDEVLAALDPLLESPFNAFDQERVVDFLGALTADGASELAELVPDSVPSGLPVD